MSVSGEPTEKPPQYVDVKQISSAAKFRVMFLLRSHTSAVLLQTATCEPR